eukprot:1453529-Lingulodinium_polyedra.AAC.1
METTLAQTVLSIYAYATRCKHSTPLLGKRRSTFSPPQKPLERLGVQRNENDFGSNGALYICVCD